MRNSTSLISESTCLIHDFYKKIPPALPGGKPAEISFAEAMGSGVS